MDSFPGKAIPTSLSAAPNACSGTHPSPSATHFQEALAALRGKDAPNLSPSVIGRLKEEWAADYARWQRRDLSARRYVYVWADGVYLQARMEPAADCMLVIIGATPEGRKELVGFQVGVRESAQSWCELLVDLQARGLLIAPELAVADGALGFWKALEEVFPATRHQRCWYHKALNVLKKVPRTLQPAVKTDLKEIWMAADRASATAALTTFAKKYAAKYAKAVECLSKDRDALLAFYDLPAEHWEHVRTTDVIDKDRCDRTCQRPFSVHVRGVAPRKHQVASRHSGHECPSAQRGAAVKPRSRVAVRLRRRA